MNIAKINKKERLASKRSIILPKSKCLCSPSPGLQRPLFIQVSGPIQNTVLNQLWPSVPVLLAELCLRFQRHWRGSLGLQVAAISGPLPYQIMSLPQRPVISKIEAWVFQRLECHTTVMMNWLHENIQVNKCLYDCFTYLKMRNQII